MKGIEINFWGFFVIMWIIALMFYYVQTWGSIEKLKVAASYQSSTVCQDPYPTKLQ